MYARHLMTDPGAFVNGEIALVAAARSAGTVTPPIAISRAPQGAQLYEGAVLLVQTGAATGTPDSFTVTCKVQTRASSSDSWADYKPDGITTAQVSLLQCIARHECNVIIARPGDLLLL